MTVKSLLEAAAAAVSQERQDAYGDHLDHARRVARLWNAYIQNKTSSDLDILDATDVAMMMALFKVARAQGGYSLDTFVDMAGYAGIAGDIAIRSWTPKS